MPNLIRQPDGRYAEPPPPDRCPNDHELGPGKVSLGWEASTGGGVRTFQCYECGAVTRRDQ